MNPRRNAPATPALSDAAVAACTVDPGLSAAQLPPAGDWSTWLLLAGRGFGKTRAGAVWIDRMARSHPGARIALVGATHADARAVMVEGDAGLRAVAPWIEYQPGLRRIEWREQGSVATLYSAEEPGTLRGPSFSFAWGDEAARWADGPAVISNLRLALRLGERPQLLLTTTPRPLAWLKALSTASGVALTRGRTADNRLNLPDSFVRDLTAEYGGTRLGRQELDGEFVEDHEAALWTRAALEACRVAAAPPLLRVVVAVDPSVGDGPGTDACGIIVAGLGEDGRAYVVADCSVQAAPAGWATAVAHAADTYGADLVVAEANNGGAMVRDMLAGADHTLNIRLVRATVGKVARAEPVAGRYDQGQVSHVGPLPRLEDELCGFIRGGRYAGPGRSPIVATRWSGR